MLERGLSDAIDPFSRRRRARVAPQHRHRTAMFGTSILAASSPAAGERRVTDHRGAGTTAIAGKIDGLRTQQWRRRGKKRTTEALASSSSFLTFSGAGSKERQEPPFPCCGLPLRHWTLLNSLLHAICQASLVGCCDLGIFFSYTGV